MGILWAHKGAIGRIVLIVSVHEFVTKNYISSS